MPITAEIKAEVLAVISKRENFLYHMVVKSVGVDDAEDVYADFVEKIVILLNENRFNYDQSTGFVLSTYLGKICTNFLVDHARKVSTRFRKTQIADRDIDFARLNIVDKPYEDSLDKSFRALKLVEGEYGFLYLEDRLLGLSYEEISAKYGVPLGTVKGNLHRIVKLLESRTQFSEEFSKEKN